MGRRLRVTERRKGPVRRYQIPTRQREEIMQMLMPWSGGQVWNGHHQFKSWDNASTQCGRCWGWIDDWRHLGVSRSR